MVTNEISFDSGAALQEPNPLLNLLSSAVDARVKNVAELSFYFHLQLPQHAYDEATNDIACRVSK